METIDMIPYGVIHEEIDYSQVIEHRDLYGALPTPWLSLEDNFLDLLPSQRIQDPTSSECVAQTAATAGEMETGVKLSATPIFQKRVGGKGSYGMALSDVAAIYQNTGTTTELLCPSLNITDAVMDSMQVPANLPFKAQIKPVYINPMAPDAMEQIKEVLDKKIGLFMTFGSNSQEWQVALNYIPGSAITFYHCITGCLPRLISTIEAIVATDTCGQQTSPKGYRFIYDAFLKSGRCTGLMYLAVIADTTGLIKDPTNEFPNMKPQTSKFWSLFHFFLGR